MTSAIDAAHDSSLELGHVRQLLRLFAEVRDASVEPVARGQHLVSGVARIVGAELAVVVLDGSAVLGSRAAGVVTALVDAGRVRGPEADVLGQARAIRALRAVLLDTMRTAPRDPGATLTVAWRELRRASAPGHEARGDGSLANTLLSAARSATSPHVHGLALYRAPDGPAFSRHERNLVQAFHAECAGQLHALAGSDDDERVRAELSPRQRQTLDLVLAGLCDKEIATRLGISRFTVNQYTKVIYRSYGVTSRTQLIARVLNRPIAACSLTIGNGAMSTEPYIDHRTV